MKENEYYSVKAVSNSAMGYINPEQGGSPRKYKKYILDKEAEKEETPSLKNGKIIHSYIENPEEFYVADINKPSEMMSEWVEEVNSLINLPLSSITEDNETLKKVVLDSQGLRYKSIKDSNKVWDKFCKEGFEYLKFLIEGSGKIIMSYTTKEIVENAIISINENKVAKELLFEIGTEFGDIAYNELPIYWKKYIGEDSVNCKALLDRVRIFPFSKVVQIIDLKTTSKAGTLFSESFRKYRYYRQLAFYEEAIKEYLKESYNDIEEWVFEHYIVSVETFGTFECNVQEVNKSWIIEGKQEYMELLKRLEYHINHNVWDQSIEEKLNKGKIKLQYDE